MSEIAGKKRLTRGEYLSLLGLARLLVAAERRSAAIEAEMYALLGFTGYDDGGYIITDEKWQGSIDIDAILKNNDITVESERASV